jgi:hypothetical protein
MSGTITAGFDVLFEISRDRLLNVLRNLLIDDVPLLTSNLPISVPLPASLFATTQQGFISLPGRPTPTLTFVPGSLDRLTLELAFPQAILSLTEILPPIDIVDDIIPGLAPTDVGSATLTLNLIISTATVDGESPITIALDPNNPTSLTNPPGIALLDLEPVTAELQRVVREAVIAAVEAVLPISIPVSLPGGRAGLCDLGVRDLQMKLLPGADNNSQFDALGFFLTVRPDEDGLVPGDADAITVSHLFDEDGNRPNGTLIISNQLLLDLLCCLVPETGLTALEGIEPERTGDCCRWTDLTNFQLGDTTFEEVASIELCVVGGGFEFRGSGMIIRGFGWEAEYSFTLPISISHEDGLIVPVVGTLDIDVDKRIEWWVWLLAGLLALVFAIIGGILGAIAGGILGATGGGPLGALLGGIAGLMVGVVAGAVLAIVIVLPVLLLSEVLDLAPDVLNQLGNLPIIPDDIKNVFGALDLVGEIVIDDLQVFGRVIVPTPKPPRAEGIDVILKPGDMFDLDRGILLPLAENPGIQLDADIAWTAGHHGPFPLPLPFPMPLPGKLGSLKVPGIVRKGATSLLELAGASYQALTENDLLQLRFPRNSSIIAGDTLPLSDTGMPRDGSVFAVRTSEGRVAKCAGWRDSRGRLHLRFKTFDTPVPLTMRSTWTSSRGAVVGTGNSGLVSYTDYEVARQGVVRAETNGMRAPLQYRWLLDGREVTGSSVLRGSLTDLHGLSGKRAVTIRVSGARCEISTPMGVAFSGELCVEVTDAGGYKVAICRTLDLPGTDRAFDLSRLDRWAEMEEVRPDMRGTLELPRGPQPDPTPRSRRRSSQPSLSQRLAEALARGMGVEPDNITLR